MLSRSRAEVVLVAVVATAAQLPTYALSHVALDEGQIVQIGYRLLNGDRLYSDIYTGIFPGIYWMAAGLLRVFGADVVVTRWAAVGVNTATTVVVWDLARRLAGRSWAWMTTLLYLALAIMSFPAFTMLAYSSVSLLCALAALLFLLRYLELGRVRDGAAVGALVVSCGVFKQNYGGLVLVSGLVSLLWSRRDSVLGRRSIGGVLAVPVAAGLVVGLPVIGYLAWAGTFGAFLFDTLLVIARSQLDAYHQPIPSIFGLLPMEDGRFIFLYSPPLLFNYLLRGTSYAKPETILELIGGSIRVGYGAALLALAAAPVLLVDRLRSFDPDTRNAARVVLPFACLFFVGLFPSAIWSHLAVVLVPLLIVLALLAKRVGDCTDRIGGGSVWVRRAAIVAIACGALAIVIKGSKNLREWHSEPMNLAGASVRVDPYQADLWRDAADFLGTCAHGDATIFVAPDMPLLYVVTGKRNPTPFDLIIPGNVEDDVIVARMRAAGTRCVVYNPRMYAQFDSFDRLFPETAAYFTTAFEVKRHIGSGPGGWLGLERKEARDGA
ncbi:MAG: glycosyltransferase family 39 protein [Deltaproteobacteria bacterium]|nr:glycosyltransferase family 39 protein [Deltaproteobacteria bacterium]